MSLGPSSGPFFVGLRQGRGALPHTLPGGHAPWTPRFASRGRGGFFWKGWGPRREVVRKM
ncbi:hypothetical protein D5272_07595 [bacterium D16-76]|nr:hypothetical protein [bacterium D16-76]